MQSAPTITFDIHKPSRLLLTSVLSVLCLALLAVCFSQVPVWIKIILWFLIGGCAWRFYSSQRTQPSLTIHWHQDGQWKIIKEKEVAQTAKLVSSRMLGALIVLRFSLPPQTNRYKTIQTVLLLPDNVDAQARRRLRIRLASA